VYLPLLAPVFAALSARWLAARLDPRLATWLLTCAAVLFAAASGAALTLLAATALGQVPWLAAGRWSVTVLRENSPTSVYLASAAGLGLAAALVAAVVLVRRRVATILAAARTAHCLPGGEQTVVLDDPVPDAYALPGWPGRIVVSTGMLDALDPLEQRVLVGHERAHLECRHHLFVAVADVAAAANPLLRPVAAAVRFSTERWADERAAALVGDRTLAARTVARAALLTRDHHRHRTAAALAIAPAGEHRTRLARLAPRLLGPVPRRVAALLVPPVGSRPLLLGMTVLAVLLTGAASIEAAHDLRALFEHAGDIS
jgi:Zn-dependent protease with chaperone function